MKLAMRMTPATGKQPSGASIGVPAKSVQLTWKGSYITFYFIVCIMYMRKFCQLEKYRSRYFGGRALFLQP
jgi:hypothetical protein